MHDLKLKVLYKRIIMHGFLLRTLSLIEEVRGRGLSLFYFIISLHEKLYKSTLHNYGLIFSTIRKSIVVSHAAHGCTVLPGKSEHAHALLLV